MSACPIARLAIDMSKGPDLKAARECIAKGRGIIEQARKAGSGGGAKESNVRHTFTSYLRLMFPDAPWWVEDHISRGEANSAFTVGGKQKKGFVDNLVGSTAIEYETDLESKPKFESGYGQVKNYCASLVNEGRHPSLVLGVLSDTIRWRAYKIASIAPSAGPIGGEHIELEEIEQVDVSSGDEVAARRLVSFLVRHLGRRGSRPLSAGTMASDLGFESMFCAEHASGLAGVVATASRDNPKYSDLIAKLWCSFVTYLRDRGSTDTFEKSGYADELYILTLAKLICAAVIERKALVSDEAQLSAILDGSYFQAKGLSNLVEYDYFGWLNRKPYIDQLLPIARAMQADLEAYDFASPPSEDLFGRMMAQLAKRTQRLLLGQEWTPAWLAGRMVDKVLSMLPTGEDPRLVDMCCGSGAMVVETVKRTQLRLATETLTREQRIQKLSQSITGFDIDPLAVMLSKVSWVLAARDYLDPLDGTLRITIPVYHADSLFAATPLSPSIPDEDEPPTYKLQIAEHVVELPGFLLDPAFQALFDAILNRAYAFAISAGAKLTLTDKALSSAVESSCADAGTTLDNERNKAITDFLQRLAEVIDTLGRDGRNGIWIFILRNSYRPGLVSGQFNGLVSNPPWLALSKVADNPYKDVLRSRAEAFGIKPAGPSHLHIELATIFLLHAVDEYLSADAAVGCIVPDTVLNGHHHNPFRMNAYQEAARPVDLQLTDIWRVQSGTFKNEACVFFGAKDDGDTSDNLPGAHVSGGLATPLTFTRVERGTRSIWTDNPAAMGSAGFFEPAAFRQGADVMPRALLFHEMTPIVTGGRVLWNIAPIDRGASPLAYLVKDAKKHRDFRITPRAVPDRFVFDVLTSNLLTPLGIAPPAKALLPIEHDATGAWVVADSATIASDPMAQAAFGEILGAFGATNAQALFEAIDSDRRKLSQQRIPDSGFLVFTGAGGSLPCAAYLPVADIDRTKLVVDQTLYWAHLTSEDEAIYLTGLLSSEAVSAVIKDFQPRGAFGERHIHTLAHEVTPPFDASQVLHQEVVSQTKALLAEYEALKGSDATVRGLLDPNAVKLDIRRRRIRTVLGALTSYEAYADACRSLYGV